MPEAMSVRLKKWVGARSCVYRVNAAIETMSFP